MDSFVYRGNRDDSQLCEVRTMVKKRTLKDAIFGGPIIKGEREDTQQVQTEQAQALPTPKPKDTAPKANQPTGVDPFFLEKQMAIDIEQDPDRKRELLGEQAQLEEKRRGVQESNLRQMEQAKAEE